MNISREDLLDAIKSSPDLFDFNEETGIVKWLPACAICGRGETFVDHPADHEFLEDDIVPETSKLN